MTSDSTIEFKMEELHQSHVERAQDDNESRDELKWPENGCISYFFHYSDKTSGKKKFSDELFIIVQGIGSIMA